MTDIAKHARRALMAVALSAVVVPAHIANAQTPPAAGQAAGTSPATAPHGDAQGQGTAPAVGGVVPPAPAAPAAVSQAAPAVTVSSGQSSSGSTEAAQASTYAPLGTHPQQQIDIGRKPTVFDVRIQGQTSLVHVGLGDSFSLTEEGINAGKLMLEGLEHTGSEKIDMAKVKEARDTWERLIPIENFGGEYTALSWFADYILGGEREKKELAADPFLQQFFELYHDEDWKGLKEFLIRKYHIREMGDEWTKEGQRRKADLELTILFNNPRREQWDNTSKAMKVIGIKPGMHIADVGSGAGYYSVKMADLVGETGKIYALDTEEDRVAYVDESCKRLGLKNVENIQTDGTTLALGGRKVDMAIMVSLYHVIYAVGNARERNMLVTDIRDSLKPDGRLIIIDNNVVAPGHVPYHGPYIAKELVAAQLVNYGFKLVAMHEYIPQRYVLEFQRDDSAKVQPPTAALAPHQVAEKIKKGEIRKQDMVRPVDFAQKVKLATPNKPAETAKPAAAADKTKPSTKAAGQ